MKMHSCIISCCTWICPSIHEKTAINLIYCHEIGTESNKAETFKLLAIQRANYPSWGPHLEFIVEKTQSGMFWLDMLRRAKLWAKDIIASFWSNIRPILEYAAPIWDPGLTTEQVEAIEAIQERVCSIGLWLYHKGTCPAYSRGEGNVNPSLRKKR